MKNDNLPKTGSRLLDHASDPMENIALPPQWVIARYSGFCFGVKRAVNAVRRLYAGRGENERIFTLDCLIHNAPVMAELETLGIKTIAEKDLPQIISECGGYNMTWIAVRAHGITRAMSQYLDEAAAASGGKLKIEDCTCPDVKHIQQFVRDNSAGRLTLIIGDPKHPEVTGIASYAAGETLICNSAEELEPQAAYLAGKNVLMVSQSTQKLTEWKKCQNFIKKVCTKPIIFDTICSVTEKRQNEVDRLSKEVGAMLIIGDRSSSNTNKLYDIAKANNGNSHFITGMADAEAVRRSGAVSPGIKVGIAAGASTPGGIIEEVIITMSENENKNPAQASDSGEENFAEMLEQSYKKNLNTGDTVKGTITSISQSEIQVDLPAKVTGILPISELGDSNTTGDKAVEKYKVGDEVEAVVVKISDMDGVATLSRKRIEGSIAWQKIVDAFNNKTIMEGTVTEVIKGGVLMAIEGIRVFIPASQTGIPRNSGDLNTLIGTTQRVKIIEIKEQRRSAVASIRQVIAEERKAKEEEFWATVEKGKWYEGPVKSIMPYGAFVDLGGIDGMVHCSELSWTRIKSPADVVSLGQVIKVYVKDFDPETKRISLGYKTEETNPWNIFAAKYKVGDVAHVKIVSMMPFGAFAEVVPGCDGLIHISQIADHKISQPQEALQLGQEVDAKITAIDNENHKISLSIRELLVKPDQGIDKPDEVAATTEDKKDSE